ncbi:collagen binding domain-containing protein [Cellulosilyticum ruminicola]|uniref:collagen binding domain-containing protein n=1 Tax=Cellulosilyticum ruminicola TaxID=425254 RepID=UPI000AF02B90|nr:collagen binding domain-containing protein [Cellulosilyticum ruminicola]
MECDFVMITGIKNEIYEVDHSKVNISNIASLRDKEGSKLTEHDAKDWVEIEVNWISKSSQYWEELKDGVTIRKIDWTVTVNSNQQDMSGYLLSDYFPVGLELEKRSIKINDIPIDEMSDIGTISYITEEGNKAYWKQGEKKSFHYKGGIKYQFKESLIFDNAHKVYKLTYTTRITDSVQDSINKGEYYNLAGIGKGAGAGTGERVFYDYKGAGIRISDVTKRAQGYNTSSHEIIWQVVANRYNNSVKQICIQDTLPEGVKLNETTVKVNDQVINTEGKAISADGDIMAAYSYDQVNQQIICNIYSQSDKFFDQYYTLQFGTIVMEKSVYANNFEQGKDYINHVKVVYTDINDVLYTSPEKTASIKVTGQVLSKHIGDYNSQTGEMTWLIVVNHNRIAMENVIINDTLEEGQQYVEGKVVEGDYSAKSLEEIEGAGNAMPTLVPQVKEGEITYNLGNIHTTYTIVLKTKVDKANVFIPNKKVVLHNTVSINSPSIFEDVKPVVIEKEINNDFVLKAGKQVDTNMPLEWYLLVNPNQVSLKSIIVKDCLSEELMPKTESIEVFRVTALTKEIKGLTIEDVEGLDKQKIILAEEQINYNKTNHTISFALGDITACYLIKFQVIVTADQPAKQYTNKATIEGIKEESWKMDSKEIEVKTQFSRSWGRVELPTGTIEIMKLDEENLMPLKGAEFKLNDGICSMTVETDDTGKAIFNGLTLGKTYKLYESKAPEGYKLNDKVEMIKLDSTQIVQLEFINKKELPSVNPSPDVNGDKEYENNDGGKTYPIPVEVIKKDQEPTNPNSYQKPIKSVPEDQKNYKDSDVERNNLQVTDDLNDNRKNQAVESLVERKDILNNEETLPKTGGITGIDFTILLGSITMMMGVVVDYYRRKK